MDSILQTSNLDELQWRQKDRTKTTAAVLALCLNLGVDPPDVVKPLVCARSQCWTEVDSSAAQQVHFLHLSFKCDSFHREITFSKCFLLSEIGQSNTGKTAKSI